MSSTAIILFGLLALTVVLANAIVITANEQNAIAAGRNTALGYCGESHPRHPDGCIITGLYQCEDYYILQSNCIGVGDVILDKQGATVDWCGYTSLDTPAPTCQYYRYDNQGANCLQSNNLCT